VSLSTLTPGTWNIDASHSTIGFTVRHLMISKVRGSFGTFSGSAVVADNIADSVVSAEIDMKSITTGDAGRDGHLQNDDFFSVDKYPTMSFRSTGFNVSGTTGTMNGELTIRGIAKPVTLKVEFEGIANDLYGNQKAGFSASGEISRKDWGIEWNAPLEAGGFVIADAVKLEFDIQLVKA
jgi:polyisoprenoid-binding protein YceI